MNEIREAKTRDARRQAKGLPVYLSCKTCDGTGLVWRCNSGCAGDDVPGYAVNRCGECCHTVDCPNLRCFDGDQVCFFCHEEIIRPRVENPGSDYIVRVLAVRVVEGEAVCELHAAELLAEEQTVTEMTGGGALHAVDDASPSATALETHTRGGVYRVTRDDIVPTPRRAEMAGQKLAAGFIGQGAIDGAPNPEKR